VLDIVKFICIGYRVVPYPSTYIPCKPHLGLFQSNITRTRWLQRAHRFRHKLPYGIRAGPLRDLAAAAVHLGSPPHAAPTTKKKITTHAAAVLSGPPSQIQLPPSTPGHRQRPRSRSAAAVLFGPPPHPRHDTTTMICRRRPLRAAAASTTRHDVPSPRSQ
jgi:hypothetical protein